MPASQRVSCLDVVYFIILNGFFFMCVSLCGYVRALVGGLREQIRVSGPSGVPGSWEPQQRWGWKLNLGCLEDQEDGSANH